MSSDWFFFICQGSIVASGLVSGVFLTFSDFVMRSLKGAGAESGIKVMQIINREVLTTLFMVLLLGMAAVSLFLAGYAGLWISGPVSLMIVVGGLLYLVGVFGVTLVFNVPMNHRLETMDCASNEAMDYWARIYLPRWTFWNSVRTAASAAAAICFLIACLWHAQGQAILG